LVIERISATSFMILAVWSQPSAIEMPGTAVSMSFVSPPFLCPGLGSNVSSWLGPPAIQRRMHDICRCRSSSARRAIRSVKLTAESPAAPRPTPRRNPRRLSTPWPFIATLTIVFSVI
jgi:hypothetical protein